MHNFLSLEALQVASVMNININIINKVKSLPVKLVKWKELKGSSKGKEGVAISSFIYWRDQRLLRAKPLFCIKTLPSSTVIRVQGLEKCL